MARRTVHRDPLVAWLSSPSAPARVSLGEAFGAMSGGGFGRALLALTLPNILVVPSVPFIPLLCGLPAMALCIQMLSGQNSVALPDWASRLSVSRARALKAARGAAWLGRLCRSGRWDWTEETLPRDCCAALVLILTAIICLPIPVLNAPPALGLLLICLGLAEKDGLVAAGGVALGLAGLFVSGLMTWNVLALAY